MTGPPCAPPPREGVRRRDRHEGQHGGGARAGGGGGAGAAGGARGPLLRDPVRVREGCGGGPSLVGESSRCLALSCWSKSCSSFTFQGLSSHLPRVLFRRSGRRPQAACRRRRVKTREKEEQKRKHESETGNKRSTETRKDIVCSCSKLELWLVGQMDIL